MEVQKTIGDFNAADGEIFLFLFIVSILKLNSGLWMLLQFKVLMTIIRSSCLKTFLLFNVLSMLFIY